MSEDYEIRSLQRDFHTMERDLADVKDDLKYRERAFDRLEERMVILEGQLTLLLDGIEKLCRPKTKT